MPLPLVIIIVAVILVIVVSILTYYYFRHDESNNISYNSDIWHQFIKNLKALDDKNKRIGLVVNSDKRLQSFAEKIDSLLLPAFDFAIQNFQRTESIRHIEINRNRNQLEPNCHVLVVFTAEIKNNQYIIKLTYYTTNAIGQRSSEPLRYRPDVMKLSYSDLNKLSRRDSLCDTFRKNFPSFIAAVARKIN